MVLFLVNVSMMRYSFISIIWYLTLVHGAVDLQGNQVVDPVTSNDPAPIGDLRIYTPATHDCPIFCEDLGNTHSWISYHSVNRLARCHEPLLLQFTVTQPVSDPNSDILIRTCSLQPKTNITSATNLVTENPKVTEDLAQQSLTIAPACIAPGQQSNSTISLSISAQTVNATMAARVRVLLKGLRAYYNDQNNCDERFAFAQQDDLIIGAYIGASLGKASILSALDALEQAHTRNDLSAERTVAQLCGMDEHSDQVLGIVIDASGSLASVQRDALNWSKGVCVQDPGSPLSSSLPISLTSQLLVSNVSMSAVNTTSKRWLPKVYGSDHHALFKRATCQYIQVQSGDGCASLASRCGISGDDFMRYNSQPNFCSTLQPGGYACCSAGDPYSPPRPSAGSDGVCATHLIANGDTCGALAAKYNVKVEEIQAWNAGKTWAWTACEDMLVGYNLCVSDGLAPMPPPQAGTECGPLVPGTKRPSDSSISLADLNPCPLKTCCSNWGFCGVFSEHCDRHDVPGGGPGSKAKGFQSTCVSNCGNEIKTNSGPPTAFRRVGYYESYNLERKCLWLNAKDANTDGTFTHMHWGFGGIDPNTWKPTIIDPHGQWPGFKSLNTKRIMSLGGWAYSTEAATYNILRSAIIDNADLFATNLARFVNDEGIDGIDIDWEYPGVSDDASHMGSKDLMI